MAPQPLNKKPGQKPKELSLEYNEPDFGKSADTSKSVVELWDFILTVSSVPTWTPRKFSEQFAIYKNGATIRFYVYDTTNGAWRYTALT